MKSDRTILFTLQHCDSIGWKSIHRLIQTTSSPQDIPHLTPKELCSILPISPQKVHTFYHQFHSLDPFQKIKQYEDEEIGFVTV
ncbi:DNA processing protein (Smf family), partial [Bacillus sp. SG-1]